MFIMHKKEFLNEEIQPKNHKAKIIDETSLTGQKFHYIVSKVAILSTMNYPKSKGNTTKNLAYLVESKLSSED